VTVSVYEKIEFALLTFSRLRISLTWPPSSQQEKKMTSFFKLRKSILPSGLRRFAFSLPVRTSTGLLAEYLP